MEILAPPFARRGRPGSVYADAGNGRPAPLRLGSRRTPPSPGGLRNAALIVAMTTKTRFLATATWPCFRYPTSISPSSTRDPECAESKGAGFAYANASLGAADEVTAWDDRQAYRLVRRLLPHVAQGDSNDVGAPDGSLSGRVGATYSIGAWRGT
jgi:hypothetical protein